MWKPDDVVAEHKKRATIVWVALLLSVVGFVVWESVALHQKYQKPSTTFEVSNKVYKFPYMEVCFDVDSEGFGEGCDVATSREDGQEDCIDTVNATIFDGCGATLDDDLVTASSNATSPNCVTFNLEAVETERLEECFDPDRLTKPSIDIKMFWIASYNASAEPGYNSRVVVYLGGLDVFDITYVPYARIVVSEDNRESEVRVHDTQMTIGQSIRKPLSGTTETSYPVLAMSTTDSVVQHQSTLYGPRYFDHTRYSPSDGGNLAVGALYITLTQGSLSKTTLSEDDPLDIPEFISSIGGFWEVLLVAWGVFFVARRGDTTPTQKARNFCKAIQRGVQRDKRPIAKEGPSTPPGIASDAKDDGEQQLKWDIVDEGHIEATGSRNGGGISANERTV